MSESKFTPGPWLRTDGAFVYALNERGTNIFWAHVQPGWKGKDAERTTDPEEAEANAKLMQQSPELLSLARRWLALDSQWHPERLASEKAQLLTETRELIAKATA